MAQPLKFQDSNGRPLTGKVFEQEVKTRARANQE